MIRERKRDIMREKKRYDEREKKDIMREKKRYHEREKEIS